WGYNATGQLGDNTTTERHSPVQVLGSLINVTQASAGVLHSVARKSDGTVWAWGDNTDGELGDNSITERNTPVQVKGPGGTGNLTGVAGVGSGNYTSQAYKSDGSVWSWGLNTT